MKYWEWFCQKHQVSRVKLYLMYLTGEFLHLTCSTFLCRARPERWRYLGLGSLCLVPLSLRSAQKSTAQEGDNATVSVDNFSLFILFFYCLRYLPLSPLLSRFLLFPTARILYLHPVCLYTRELINVSRLILKKHWLVFVVTATLPEIVRSKVAAVPWLIKTSVWNSLKVHVRKGYVRHKSELHKRERLARDS